MFSRIANGEEVRLGYPPRAPPQAASAKEMKPTWARVMGRGRAGGVQEGGRSAKVGDQREKERPIQGSGCPCAGIGMGPKKERSSDESTGSAEIRRASKKETVGADAY